MIAEECGSGDGTLRGDGHDDITKTCCLGARGEGDATEGVLYFDIRKDDTTEGDDTIDEF